MNSTNYITKNKKRILMICESYGGGVFEYINALCNAMIEYFDIYLAYSIRQQTPPNYSNLIDSRVKLYKIDHFGDIKNPIHVVQSIQTLKRLEKEIKPDVIHLHSSIAGALGRTAFKNKKNVIYTPHGYAHILMDDKLSIYESIEKILGKTKGITLTCSKSEDNIAKKLCKRTAYIETGLNLKTFDTYLKESNSHLNPTVITVGRICSQKQPYIFNAIASKLPNLDFMWIGDGELRNELTSSNIKITGWIDRKDAISITSNAKIYILCSKGEAIAMCLLENMYMRNLCLVSNVMGNCSVIKNGVNGYLCNTVNDYVQRIQEALDNYPTDLVNNAYNDIITIYNSEVMNEKYIPFYNRIINEYEK